MLFNIDQGRQFASFGLTSVLCRADIQISMGGRGLCMDNIFIERPWRSLKYEAVNLREMTDGFAARRAIDEWIGDYDATRLCSAPGGRMPQEACEAKDLVDMMDMSNGLPTYPLAQQSNQDVIEGVMAV